MMKLSLASYLNFLLLPCLLHSQHLREHRSLQNPIGFPDGTFATRGYGVSIQVAGDDFKGFEETNISCIDNSDEILSLITEVQAEGGVGVLRLNVDGIADIYADPLADGFVAGCSQGVTLVEGDDGYEENMVEIFDIVASTFSEHYAFFEQRQLDWDSMTSEARASLQPNSTDTELYDAFVAVMSPLNDGHVQFQVVEDGEVVDFYSSKPLEIVTRIQQEFLEQSDVDDFETFQNGLLLRWIGTVNGFMEDGLNGDIDSILWGKFSGGNVGYMMMQGFSTDDEEAFRRDVREAFIGLNETDSIIFDIRINGGGDDETALHVASYFTSERMKAFSKKAWDPNSPGGFSPETEIYLEPNEEQSLLYTNEVVLIASGSTVSAAEIFALSMFQLPQVTLFGRPTSGEFSDILPRTLPNKWRVGLTNEVYSAPDGTVYEITGIPPTVLPEAELLPLTELTSGKDSWLEQAFAIANETTTDTPTNSPTSAPSESSADMISVRLLSSTTIITYTLLAMIGMF